MPCSSCTELKPIPICFTTLDVGTVTADTAYKVYVKNTATNRENVYDITSQGDGILQIDRDSDAVKITPADWHEIRAVLATAESMNDNANISINSTNYTCLLAQFQPVLDGALELEAYTSVTAEIA